MKKIIYTLTILFGLPNISIAQDLFVSPNSYVFVQDEVLFVNNDIQLDADDSFLYLRDGAQLLQNTDTKNSDSGELSVYQEQTTGIYEYNFWCSPVGKSIDGITKANVNFDITNLHKPDNPSDNSDVNSDEHNTTTSLNGTVNEISSYWLWKMEAADGYNGWSHISNWGNAESGLGFTMKGTLNTDKTIDFRGRPNTGTITQSCEYNPSSDDPNYGTDGKVTTLTGNPYPSAMDLLLFLRANETVLEKQIYFWEQKKGVNTHVLREYQGGYAVWAPSDITDDNDTGIYTKATFQNYDGNGNGVGNSPGGQSDDYTNRRYAAIGQGFIVKNGGTSNSGNGGDFIIDNSMRVYMQEAPDKTSNGSHFGRTNSNRTDEAPIVAMSHNGLDYKSILENPTTIPEIRIHTHINDSYYRENVLAFNPSKSLDFNTLGGDGISPNVLDTDTYFIASDYKLVIKSIAYDIDVKLPFGLNAQNETNIFSITINEMKDVSENIEVFIHDKELDTYTNIISNTFDITLPKGEYNDRFEIVFKDSRQLLDNEDFANETIESFDVYQNNKIKEFVINNPKSHVIKSFTMFDVTGKVIFKKQNLGNQTQYTFPTNTISSGTYITKITTDQNIDISKKIIVKN
jgi:hypothetical protein